MKTTAEHRAEKNIAEAKADYENDKRNQLRKQRNYYYQQEMELCKANAVTAIELNCFDMASSYLKRAKELQNKITNRYKFARKCDITGEGFNDGYCINDGEMYIKYEKDLIAHLRTLEDTDLSDFYLLKESYEVGYYYYSDWEVDESDEWYESEFENGTNATLVRAK